jgi:hypothetical protein
VTTSGAVLVDRLGRDNAERLVAISGGRRLSVPSRLAGRAHARLAALLGEDLAILVVLHFGDSRLSVPLSLDGPGGARTPLDARKIRRLAARGWTTARIARELNCSERAIHAKRAAYRLRTPSRTREGDD